MKNKKGKIIELEGSDCSFKETNAKALYDYIKENITKKVKIISFPTYESESSIFVKKYLKGEYGKIKKVNAYQASVGYAMNRFDTCKELNIEKLVKEGYYIILDRYTGSNILHQIFNIDDYNERVKYISWILDLEYDKLKLPKPDITLFLSNHYLIIDDLLKKKKKENKESVKGDITESDDFYQYKAFKNSNLICELLNWEKIDCYTKAEIGIIKTKNRETIINEIISILKNNFIL